MLVRIGKLAFVLILLGSSLAAQSNNKNSSQILNDGSKPPVFIEFVRTGVCKKDTSNFNSGNLCNSTDRHVRVFDVAWLRLVNNTRWSIGVTVDKAATDNNSTSIVIPSTEFTDDDGRKAWYGKPVAKNASEMDIVYNSEVETGCDFSMPKPKGKNCYWIEAVAPKIPLPAISSDLFVAPGESVLFPLDRGHVKKYVNIYVFYNFSWEYSGQFFRPHPHYDSQHRAYFGWFDLEKGIAKENEAKKPVA